MVGNQSVDSGDNDTGPAVKASAARVAALTAMCGLDVVAFCANLTILIVIIRSLQLRQTLANLFLINLCLVDFLSSVLVLPVSIFTYIEGFWRMNGAFCLANGFISSLLIFCSTTTLCVISMERYYSIRSPMHHAAHMTLCKTGLVIASIWIYSGLFASLPLLGWNTYRYNPSKAHCSFTWETEKYHRLFILCVFMVYFALPGVILFSMYCGIYRVAKRASSQVNPSPHTVTNWREASAEATTSVSSSSHPASPPVVQLHPAPHIIVSQSAIRANRTPLKAIKTLMIILSMYIFLWGPYFISHLNGAMAKDIPNNYDLNLLFEWIGFVSFALNPFLYGIMNRTIREECSRLLKKIICCKNFNRIQDAVDGPNSNEDFYQFLERTSVAGKPKRDELRTRSEATSDRF